MPNNETVTLAYFQSGGGKVTNWQAQTPELAFDLQFIEFTIQMNGLPAGRIVLRKNAPMAFRKYYGDIYYEIRPKYRGRGLARKACLALREIAIERGFPFLFINCNADNPASKKTIEKLGVEFLETFPGPPPCLRFLWKLT